MAEISYPWNPGDPGGAADLGSWINIFRALGGGGVIIGEGNECILSAPGGFQVNVGTGKATALGHYYENDTAKTIALTANNTGAIRFDRVVIRFDVQNRTAIARVVPGNNAGPPALQADPTNLYDLNLGVIQVATGTPSIGSGNITVASDRWSSGLNEGEKVGNIIDSTRRITTVGKLYVPAYGQGPVSRWKYEKLWDVWPTMGGFATPPFYGRYFDGSDRLLFPDLRDRLTLGVDDMGQGSGQAAGLLRNPQPSLGMYLGSAQIAKEDLPEHSHDLDDAASPHTLYFIKDSTSQNGVVATSPPSATYSGAYATAAGVAAHAAQFGETPRTGLNAAATLPNGTDDNRIPPALLVYKLIRVA